MPRPAKPDIIRNGIAHYVREYTEHGLEATKGHRNAVQKYVCQAWTDEDIRHACVGWLFGTGPIRMADLTDAQIMALKRWINARQINGTWLPDMGWEKEAEWIKITVSPKGETMPKNKPDKIDIAADKVIEKWERENPNNGTLSMVEASMRDSGGKVVEFCPDPDAPEESMFVCDE